jgi:molybdopterin molybdotransferase
MKTLDQIAAALAGYDPQALSVDMAQRFIDDLVSPCPVIEHLCLLQSLGRVVAQDVISPIDVPAHDNSAMDGYAFAGGELGSQVTLSLNVVGTALAGKAWSGALQPGQCIKIMTGAIMPEGLDTVIPQELTSRSLDTVSIPVGAIRIGDNRRFKGEDIAKGGIALEKGSMISPAALGLLASLGVPTVPVVRKLKVAYFSTGDEILSLGEHAREGAVYDSNRYTIHGLLSRMGVDIIDLGVVRDNPVELEAAFLKASSCKSAMRQAPR